jgi:mono/diheme cytochrome c family protein
MSSASSNRRTHHNGRYSVGVSLKCEVRNIVRVPWLVAVLVLAGCDNMKDQPNLRPLDATSHFPNGSSAQSAPAHTVALEAPDPSDVFNTGSRQGTLTDELPVPLTADLLARGRERFNVYCAPCHGEDGYGRGIVVRRGFPAPPSYHDDRLLRAPVGHFFDVITRGQGVMYAYADRVNVNDRWAIAAYIRALQRSQHASLADVPTDQRSQLAAP